MLVRYRDGYRRGGGGSLLTTKIWCICMHIIMHNVDFPLYEFWWSSKRRGSDPDPRDPKVNRSATDRPGLLMMDAALCNYIINPIFYTEVETYTFSMTG